MKAETFLLIPMGLFFWFLVGLGFLAMMYIGTATRIDVGDSTCYHIVQADQLSVTTCVSGPVRDQYIAPYGHH